MIAINCGISEKNNCNASLQGDEMKNRVELIRLIIGESLKSLEIRYIKIYNILKILNMKKKNIKNY